MAAFSSTSFSTSAFSVLAYDFGATPIVIDTHDGGESERKRLEAERARKEDRHERLIRTYEEIVEGKVFSEEAADIVRPFLEAPTERAYPLASQIAWAKTGADLSDRLEKIHGAMLAKLKQDDFDLNDLTDMH